MVVKIERENQESDRFAANLERVHRRFWAVRAVMIRVLKKCLKGRNMFVRGQTLLGRFPLPFPLDKIDFTDYVQQGKSKRRIPTLTKVKVLE